MSQARRSGCERLRRRCPPWGHPMLLRDSPSGLRLRGGGRPRGRRRPSNWLWRSRSPLLPRGRRLGSACLNWRGRRGRSRLLVCRLRGRADSFRRAGRERGRLPRGLLRRNFCLLASSTGDLRNFNNNRGRCCFRGGPWRGRRGCGPASWLSWSGYGYGWTKVMAHVGVHDELRGLHLVWPISPGCRQAQLLQVKSHRIR